MGTRCSKMAMSVLFTHKKKKESEEIQNEEKYSYVRVSFQCLLFTSRDDQEKGRKTQ